MASVTEPEIGPDAISEICARVEAKPSRIRGVHPACALIPPASDDEIEAIVRSIQAIGQTDPVVVTSEGLIVDGRARIAACGRLGIEPQHRFLAFKNEDSVVAFVIARHLAHRSLTSSQKATLALRLIDLTGMSKSKAAERLGISFGIVKLAAQVERRSPALAAEVARGKVSVHEAHRRIERQPEPLGSRNSIAIGPFASLDDLLLKLVEVDRTVHHAGIRSTALRQFAMEVRRLVPATRPTIAIEVDE